MSPEPAYPPCQGCLDSLDYGIIAWERHLEKEHAYKPKPITMIHEDVPFCETICDFTRGEAVIVHAIDINEIIRQLNETIPFPHSYMVSLAVKLAYALAKQEMTKQEKPV